MKNITKETESAIKVSAPETSKKPESTEAPKK